MGQNLWYIQGIKTILCVKIGTGCILVSRRFMY